MIISKADYNYPLGVTGGFFSGKTVPQYNDYLETYHTDFLKYLYYIMVKGAEGNYPDKLSPDDLKTGLNNWDPSNCSKAIKKILIGEAPTPVYANYFYNPYSNWNPMTGRPGKGQYAWTGAIQKVLFSDTKFADKISFLKACAGQGFLLYDLFPYAVSIKSNNRKGGAYKSACISAFGAYMPFPYNFLAFLNQFKNCLNKQLSIAFGLKIFGEVILRNSISVDSFHKLIAASGIFLYLGGPIDITRTNPSTIVKASRYLRVCGRQGLFGPCPDLMNKAGI